MKKCTTFALFILVTIALSVGESHAQKIQRAVMGSGGTLYEKTSANWLVSGLAGQLAIDKRNGQVNGQNVSVYQGFWVPLEFNVTGVGEPPAIVKNTELRNYPNPASYMTTFSYILPGQAYVTLKLYDVAGNLVKLIFEGNQDGGQQQLQWDLKDVSGLPLSSGSYLYELDVSPAQLVGMQAFTSYTARNMLVIVK